MRFRRICVFCGSSPGVRAEYLHAAHALGKLLAEQEIGLVYGGAGVGLMGALADSCLHHDGEVIGVIPQHLVDEEVAHLGLTHLRVVASMHERKAMMCDLSDGFIALPGGLGTLEELFEVWTWAQLGIHKKPVGLFNVAGFYEPLAALISRITDEGFMRAEHRDSVVLESDPETLLNRMATHLMPDLGKWWSDPSLR